MSKDLQVGNKIFPYPDQGEGAGHGEDATAWAVQVTDVLKTVQGPNDLLETTSVLANNITTPTNIPNLVFNTGQVQHVIVEFIIQRTYDSGASILVESGTIQGNFNGSDFRISQMSTGDDSGIEIDVTSGGQFTYTSTDLSGHQNSLITFKAKTIDN